MTTAEDLRVNVIELPLDGQDLTVKKVAIGSGEKERECSRDVVVMKRKPIEPKSLLPQEKWIRRRNLQRSGMPCDSGILEEGVGGSAFGRGTNHV
jgi:hypothetical protein